MQMNVWMQISYAEVSRKMVKFNPGLSQILSTVFLFKNIQFEVTKCYWALTPRYGNYNTKCYSKQYIGRENKKTEQNFNPGLALIGFSGTRPQKAFFQDDSWNEMHGCLRSALIGVKNVTQFDCKRPRNTIKQHRSETRSIIHLTHFKGTFTELCVIFDDNLAPP